MNQSTRAVRKEKAEIKEQIEKINATLPLKAEKITLYNLKWKELRIGARKSWIYMISVVALSTGWYIQTITMKNLQKDMDYAKLLLDEYNFHVNQTKEIQQSHYIMEHLPTLVKDPSIQPDLTVVGGIQKIDTAFVAGDIRNVLHDEVLSRIGTINVSQKMAFDTVLTKPYWMDFNTEATKAFALHERGSLQNIGDNLTRLTKIDSTTHIIYQDSRMEYVEGKRTDMKYYSVWYMCLYVLGVVAFAADKALSYLDKEREKDIEKLNEEANEKLKNLEEQLKIHDGKK